MTGSARARRLVVVLVTLLMAACARGADEERLVRDLQERLNRDVKPGLFEVVGVRREGSAPLPAGESGADRVVVYFNATLKLSDKYQFGGWDQLAPASVAYALGATEKGVFGLSKENKPGDIVRAYGSAIYEETSEGWTPQPPEIGTAAAAAPITDGAPPSLSKQLIDKLAAMVDLPPPGVPPQQDEIIAQELAAASENIERRVKRREHTYTVASGPADGEYTRFSERFIAAVTEAAPDVKLRQRTTPGSVDNAWLLSRGEADYAIVQGDVAAAALNGEGPFARGGPLTTLRAVGALFPEPIHIVVLPDSAIRDVAALRGRRVAIGLASSGTHFDATAVLAAHNLQLSDLQEAAELGVADALARLRRKQLDAVFVTGAAPMRVLQQFAVNPGLRLVPLGQPGIETVVKSRHGLAPIVLPPNTYPQQQEAIATVAAVALLVTTSEAPEREVQRVRELLSRLVQQPSGNGEGAEGAAVATSRTIPIPLHPGAERHVP
jgi:TRAP transporter TAXI family solute receptor